jgi:hypothetical protein
MPSKRDKPKPYGLLLAEFVGTYVGTIAPFLRRGKFDGEGAALYMEHLRAASTDLAGKRIKAANFKSPRGKVREAIGIYKEVIGQFKYFLENLSAQEARQFFEDERKRKTLLSKLGGQVREIDRLMNSSRDGDYSEFRPRFAKRVERL